VTAILFGVPRSEMAVIPKGVAVGLGNAKTRGTT
jgi:hypothetical protein